MAQWIQPIKPPSRAVLVSHEAPFDVVLTRHHKIRRVSATDSDKPFSKLTWQWKSTYLFQHDIWNEFDFMADFLTILEYQNILGWYHQTHHIGTSKRHLFNPTSEFAVLALCCLVLITKGYHHLGQGTRKNHMCPAMDPKNHAFLDPENWKPRTSLAWSNSSKLSAKRGSCLANIWEFGNSCHLISLKFWYQILQV